MSKADIDFLDRSFDFFRRGIKTGDTEELPESGTFSFETVEFGVIVSFELECDFNIVLDGDVLASCSEVVVLLMRLVDESLEMLECEYFEPFLE